MPEVAVRKGEPIDRALKRLKSKLEAEGIMDEVRRLRAFETPTQRTKRKAKANAKRAKAKFRFNVSALPERGVFSPRIPLSSRARRVSIPAGFSIFRRPVQRFGQWNPGTDFTNRRTGAPAHTSFTNNPTHEGAESRASGSAVLVSVRLLVRDGITRTRKRRGSRRRLRGRTAR